MARKMTKKIIECPKCGHSLKVMKFANESKAQITCPDCGWRAEKTETKPTMAIAVLFYDCRFEGVEAIVTVKPGDTADQTFETYLIVAAKEQEVEADEVANWRNGYGYEELPITTL